MLNTTPYQPIVTMPYQPTNISTLAMTPYSPLQTTPYNSIQTTAYAPIKTQVIGAPVVAPESAVSTIARLNDPYQLNTILDVLFNEAGLKRAYGNASLTARLNAIKDIMNNQYLQPALKGNWGIVGLNTLTGLGETLDVFGNIVKGVLAPNIDKSAGIDYSFAEQAVAAVQDKKAILSYQSDGSPLYSTIIDGKLARYTEKDLKLYEAVVNSGRTVNIANLTTKERVKAAIGIGDYGRINFEANSGKGLFADIFLELMLDPETWVTLGGTTAARVVAGQVDDVLKTTAKSVDDIVQALPPGIERDVARNAAAQLMEENTRRVVARAVTQVLRQKTVNVAAKDWKVNELLKSLVGGAVKSGPTFNTYQINNIADAINYVYTVRGIYLPNIKVDDTAVRELIQRSSTKYVNNTAVTIARSLDTLKYGMDKTQGLLAKAALTPAGVYPIYAIAKKAGPGVAALVKNTLKSADDIHANAFGNRPLLSYFTSNFTDERTKQTITDMLPDDVKFLFRSPEKVRLYETQLNEDLVFFDTWCRSFGTDKSPQKLQELRDFVVKSQGVQLEDLPQVVHNLLSYLDEDNTVLEKYSRYVAALVPRILKQEEHVNALQKLADADGILDTLRSADNVMTKAGVLKAKVSPIAQHTYGLRKAVVDMLHSNSNVTIDSFVELLNARQVATLQSLETLLNPLKQFSVALAGPVNTYLNTMFDAITKQNDLLLKQVKFALDDTGVFKFTDYDKLMMNLFENSVQNYLKADLDSLFTGLEQRVHAYYLMHSKALETMLRPASYLDNIATLQGRAQESYKKLNTEIHRLKKEYLGTEVTDEVTGMKLRQCTPAGMFSKEVQTLRTTLAKAVVENNIYVLTALKNETVPAIPYDAEEIEAIIKEWMVTDLDDVAYKELYQKVDNIVFNAQARLKEIDYADVGQNVGAIRQDLSDVKLILQTKLNPAKRIALTERVTSYEDYITVTQENFTSLIQIMEDESVNKFISEVRAGPISKQLRDVIGNPLYSEDARQAAAEVLETADTFDKLKHLVYNIGLSDMRPEAKANFFATVVKYFYVNPESFEGNANYWVDELLEAMPLNTQYSKQYKRKLALNNLMQDNEYHDSIQEVFDEYGVEMPKTELHTGLSDSLILSGVLRKMAETDPKLKTVLDNNVILFADTEASSANILADVTTTHQLAFLAQHQGKPLTTYAQNVSEDVIDNSIPNRDYVLDLYDAAQHSEHNLDREKYNPLFDYTTADVDMDKFYKDHLKGDVTEVDATNEANLYLDFFYKMYKTITESAKYDPESKTFNATLFVHNGNGFDLPLWKAKINQYDLYDLAATNPNYGFDLHFLDHIQFVDTWEILKKYDDYFEFTGAEEAAIRTALLQYADGISDANKIFTPISIDDLNKTRHLLETMQKTAGFDSEHAQMYDELFKLIKDAKKPFNNIFKTNRGLSGDYIPANIMRGKQYQSSWNTFMRKEMGMTRKEIEERFGKNMSNVQLSSLFAAVGDYQTRAYTWKVLPKQMDRWFIGTFTRTQLGQVSYKEAVRLTKTAKVLTNIADKIRHPEVYASYMPEMTGLIKTMLQDKMRFGFLKYLRTDGLNTIETCAVYRYLTSKCDNGALYAYCKQAGLEHQYLEMSTLARTRNLFTNVAEDRFARSMQNDNIQTALAYTEQLAALMNVKTSFDQFSHWLDNKGLVSSAATIQIKAMEPVTDTLTELLDNIGLATQSGGYDTVSRLFKQERDMTSNLAYTQTKQLLELNADDTVRWLTRSVGCVALPITSFGEIGGYETYKAFLHKLETDEFKAANIAYVEDGRHVIVRLSRKADFKVRVNFETGEKFYYANGQVIPAYDHKLIDATLVKEAYTVNKLAFVRESTLAKAIDAVDFMTDGKARGTLYDMLGIDAFKSFYETLPQEMLDDFYTLDELSAPALWDTTNYNFTILGSIEDRNKAGVKHSGRFLSALRNAAEYKMHEHGVKNVYVQSMLSDTNAIQNNELGRLIVKDEPNVIKWFSENPDYTAAALVEDKLHKQGYKIVQCDMTTSVGVRQALELNAKVVTYSEFNKLYEVINSNIFSETSARGWQTLVRMFKIGYLVNPGTWARNSLDAFLKNSQATGVDPVFLAKHYRTAVKDKANYDRVVMDLKNLGNGHFPVEGEMIHYFKGCGMMDYKKFKVLHSFFSDPAAGGESMIYTKMNNESRKRYLEQMYNAGHITTDEYKKQQMRLAYNSTTNALLTPMNEVERVSRLAAYQVLTKQGYTNNTALRIVEQTHFAYSVKSETEQALELLIPFYTFISRNFTWWMEALDKDPRYFAMLRDVLEPALNLEQYSPEEMEENESLQRNILSGNIKCTDDYYWSMSLSFMDSLKWLTNPIGQTKNSIFSPVQAFVNVWLQNAADEEYQDGNEVMSHWLQNTFGLKMTKEEVEAKYGAWASEYEKLYGFRISNLDPTKSALDDLSIWQLIPLIGTQMQRLETTGVYYDDGDGIKAMLYLLGVAGKVNRWDDVKLSKKLNQDIGQIIGSSDYEMSVYSRLKAAMGYSGVSLKDLPYDVKQSIFALLNGVEPPHNIVPVVQDRDAMYFMWTALKQKYGVSGTPLQNLDKETLQQMYFDIAKSTVHVANIQDMLSEDEIARYTYGVVRKQLGLVGLKVYQLPLEALEVIEVAMQKHLYVPRTSRGYTKHARTRRFYAKKTYTGDEGPGTRDGYFGVTPYDTNKGVHANYGQTQAQNEIFRSNGIYKSNYTAGGKSRMELLMMPITPQNFKYRIKDQFYYYR